jgi:predicted nucleic acid-binding protein
MIDTNILMNTLSPSRPECREARELIDRCSGWGEFGMASSLSFKDVYYLSSRMFGERQARAIVEHLMGMLAVAPVDAEVCHMALRSDEPDFEDGIIRACAELNGADFIVTHDREAFAHSTVRSVSDAEYLDIARSRDRAAARFA